MAGAFLLACSGDPAETEPPAAEPGKTAAEVDPSGSGPPLGSIARQRLEPLARREAARAENPWALLHGLLAFGAEFRADDGRSAWAIVAGHAAQTEDGTWDLPAVGADNPVEPHDGMTARVLTVSRPKSWTGPLGGVQGAPSAAQLVEGATRRLDAAAREPGWPGRRDAAWMLGAACAGSEDGSPLHLPGVDLDALALEVAELAAGECSALEADFARGAEEIDKDGEGIFAHPCGGLHLLQGLVVCAAKGVGGQRFLEQEAHQLELLRWRLRAETALYERLLSEHGAEWESTGLLAIQALKFSGHTLETLARAKLDRRAAGSTVDAAFEADLRFAAEATDRAVLRLEDLGLLEDEYLATLREGGYQQYLNLVGDSCHALRGLALYVEGQAGS